jgi:hypothetical protein
LFASQLTASSPVEEPEEVEEVEVVEVPAVPVEGESEPGEEVEEVEEVETELKADLSRWQRKAAKNIGKPLALEFISDEIPADLHAQIVTGLKAAKTVQEVRDVFKAVKPAKAQQYDSEALKALAQSIEKAVDSMATPSPTYNFTMPQIQLTAQMPAQGQPSVTFAPVIQPSEVAVKNEVTVQPAAVSVPQTVVENNVTVQPAQVSFPVLPSEAEITTDFKGKKTLRVKK